MMYALKGKKECIPYILYRYSPAFNRLYHFILFKSVSIDAAGLNEIYLIHVVSTCPLAKGCKVGRGHICPTKTELKRCPKLVRPRRRSYLRQHPIRAFRQELLPSF